MPSSSILVLGIGNYLMGDEGLGVHVVNQLKEEVTSDFVDIMDGGTAGFQLMEYLETYPHVIMIDATLDGDPAGTIKKIRPRFSKDFPTAMSTHEIGLKDLMEGLLLLGKMPDIHLFIMSIDKIQPLSTLLSKEIEDSLPELKRQIVALVDELTLEVVQTM